MNIVEAMKEVRNGKTITRKSWFDNIVVMLSSGSEKIVVYNTTAYTEFEYNFSVDDIEAYDWVIKNYKRSLTFFEAFKEIKDGKKVRIKRWNDDRYITKDTP